MTDGTGSPLSHRKAVGGMWEEIGRLQFDYLVRHGLKPDHRLLDVGCGALRGGIHFIRYLDPGNYFGIDRNSTFLDAGRRELELAGLSEREIHLRTTDAFDVDFGMTFDFALAQSLFTHLPRNSIRMCLMRVAPMLAPDGRLFATFFRAPGDPLRPAERDGGVVTYYDRDPYHYPAEDLEWAATQAGLAMTDVGEWEHPRGQEMLLFRRVPSSTTGRAT